MKIAPYEYCKITIDLNVCNPIRGKSDSQCRFVMIVSPKANFWRVNRSNEVIKYRYCGNIVGVYNSTYIIYTYTRTFARVVIFISNETLHKTTSKSIEKSSRISEVKIDVHYLSLKTKTNKRFGVSLYKCTQSYKIYDRLAGGLMEIKGRNGPLVISTSNKTYLLFEKYNSRRLLVQS